MFLPALGIASAVLLLYFPVMSLAEECDCKISYPGLIVPLYFPPDGAWDSIVRIKHAYPSMPIIAIVNPSNGPGEFDQSFEDGIQKMQSSGITVLGYVFTQYGNRNSTFVKDDIDKYDTWYHTNGIFFDEMSHSTGNETYYSDLSNYAKSKGLGFTVGNSGVDVSPSYVGTVDNIVIYDNSGLPSIDSLGGWHKNYDKKNFSVMSYGVTRLDDSYLKNLSNYIGYVYVTDDNDQDNPWDVLSSYVKNITPHMLTVNSQDVYGNIISGLYTELYQNGATISGGFTPHTFTFNDTKKHVIHVENYGNYKFDHWLDTNSHVRERPVSITNDTSLVAVFKDKSPVGDSSTISVNVIDSLGNELVNFYVSLWQNSHILWDDILTKFYDAKTGNDTM